MKLSEKIYRLRTENDLTQAQFGTIAGATNKAVSTWERGEKEPRMKPLQKICGHFGIDLLEFVDTNNDVYKKKSPPPNEDELRAQYDAQLAEFMKLLTLEQKRMLLAWMKALEADQ